MQDSPMPLPINRKGRKERGMREIREERRGSEKGGRREGERERERAREGVRGVAYKLSIN